jgi:phosphoribosylanthranilate isomerase
VTSSPPDRRVRVKICGVTRVADARLVEAAGADAVGLIFAERSVRRVDLDRARAIADGLAPFVTRVGVFQGASEAEVRAAVAAAGLHAVQLHGAVDDAVAARLRADGVQVIRAVRFEPGLAPDAFADRPFDAVLLDGVRPGSGTAFDWTAAVAWRGWPRLILAGGLRPGTVADGIAALRPYAVDVASGVEREPGIKDAEAVRAFVAAARSG